MTTVGEEPFKLRREAKGLIRDLRRAKMKLVLAESCTGGSIAALLTEFSGVSDVFCGSKVVYREDSKAEWLRVSRKTIRSPGVVSQKCAEEMVRGVLKSTPEASVAASITGFLGPTGESIGQVFISVLSRKHKAPITYEFSILPPKMTRPVKTRRDSGPVKQIHLRMQRRQIAARITIILVRALLKA